MKDSKHTKQKDNHRATGANAAPSAYSVELTRAAEKDLDKLSTQVQNAADELFERLETEPLPAGAEAFQEKSFKHKGYNLYRVRIGDFRVVYDLDHKQKLITVHVVAHRKVVYELTKRRL